MFDEIHMCVRLEKKKKNNFSNSDHSNHSPRYYYAKSKPTWLGDSTGDKTLGTLETRSFST